MSLVIRGPATESSTAPESAARPIEELAAEGFNVGEGLKRVGGRPATYLRILRKFRDSQADSPERIEHALQGRDYSTAERLAHTVKGVAGSIGAHSLFELAGNLEQALRGRSPHDEAFQAFRDELNRVIRVLTDFLGDVPAPGREVVSAPLPDAIAAELIHELTTLLREHDSAAVDYLARNEHAFRAAMGGERYDELETAINDFDFKTAAARLAPYLAGAP